MITDDLLYFSDEQAVTVTAASTNVLDLGDATDSYYNTVNQEYASGKPIFVNVRIPASFATLTSIGFKLQESDDNSSFTDVAGTATTVALADAVAGYGKDILLPTGLKRYLRMYYTVTGPDATAGTISAFLTAENYK